MAQELFCSRCGLAIPLDEIDLSPCVACGNALFVPAKWISWEAALTPDDKKFLRVNKISAT